MSLEDATEATPEAPNRTGIIGVFVLCGGLLGGWGISVVGAGAMLFQSGGDPIALLLSLVFGWIAGLLGMFFGLPYATFAGVIYAYLPPRFQRVSVAPVVGAVSVLLLYGGFKLLTRSWSEVSGLLTMVAAGAVAAFGCAWIVRSLGLDGAGGRKPAQQKPPKAWGVQD